MFQNLNYIVIGVMLIRYGDYNTVHNHRGSILSGVFYIDVPDENMGNINFFKDQMI